MKEEHSRKRNCTEATRDNMRFSMKIVYSLAVFILLLQIVNCEKNKHCKDDEHCLVNANPKKLKEKTNSYEATYKKKYESYAAARSKQESSEAKKAVVAASEKDCNKRKYQLNCSKSWKKAKNGGEGSAKNSKVYIKRENNPLLNLDNDGSDYKKKKQKPEQRKGKPAPPKVQEKHNKKSVLKAKLEKVDSSSDEDGSDNEWW